MRSGARCWTSRDGAWYNLRKRKERAIRINPNIKDLYDRLKSIGFDRKFVRNHVLPDWWEDSLAAVPANRALAETCVARFFRFRIADVRSPSGRLSLPAASNFRLKRQGRTRPGEFRGAVLVAQRIAQLVVGSLEDMPPFRAGLSAGQVRTGILGECPTVDLAGLVEFCWKQGIVVLHLDPHEVPRKHFQGLAMFVAQTPVVVLAYGQDSPPRLAFHLAHELGHVLRGDVKPHDKPLVDSNLDLAVSDQHEKAADRFAIEALTGEPEFSFRPTCGMTAGALAQAAAKFGRKRAIDPGTVALVYGFTARRFPVAQSALNALGRDHGAHKTIADALLRRLDLDALPETTARYLSCLSAVEG